MGSVSDIATINISTSAVLPSEPGFGVPLILSASAGWAERVRTYSKASDVAVDFATSTPEYLAAAALFSQNPAPPTLKIGRRANKPTQHWTITPTAVNSTVYQLTVDGYTVSYTSDSSATAAEIVAGLKAAIDALSLALTTGGTSTLTIAANAAGAWHRISGYDRTLLSVAMDHSDPGLAADLAAIAQEDNTWYAILNLFNSAAEVAAIAAYAEANQKLFLWASQDTGIIGSGSSDIASTLQTAVYARSPGMYHPDNGAFLDAAVAGCKLPTAPGSETWAYAQPKGVAKVNLTPSEVTHLKAKNCNYFYDIAGIGVFLNGVCPSGDYIDIIRGRDWLAARLGTRMFTLLLGAQKVPYTDAGIARVEGEVRAQMSEGIAQGFIAADPAPVVSVPLAANVSPSDKAARVLNNVQFTATLQGAIQKMVITGVLTV